MTTRPAVRAMSAACLLSLAMLAATARGDEPRPTFDCLPTATVFAMHAPAPSGSIERLRHTTKLGQLMLSEARLGEMLAAIEGDDPAMREQLDEELAEVGLTVDDLKAVGHGAMGYAMTVHPAGQPTEPAFIGIAWINPGQAMAAKYLRAIEKGIDNDAGEPHAAKRESIKVAGRDVLLIRTPILETDWDEVDFDGLEPDDEGEVDDAQEDELPRQQVDQENTLIVRLGGRLVIVHSVPQNAAKYWAMEDPDAADFDKLSDLALTERVLADLIGSHFTSDPGVTYAQRTLAAPGVRAALPTGPTLAEAFADLRPLWKIIRSAPRERDEPGIEILQATGVMDLSVAALRWTVESPGVRGGMFLAAPAPRRGVLATLDQKPLPARVPAWVPADAVSYMHLSVDLGPAWSAIKQAALEHGGEAAGEVIKEIEFNVDAYAQKDLAAVLTGLGQRHAIIGYPPIVKADAGAGTPDELSRFAVVWQLQDARTWKTIVQGLGVVAMMSDGKIANAYDGEWVGYRSRVPGAEGSLMHGHGYLTFGVGKGVSRPLRAALADPPAGDKALANTAGYKRFIAAFQPADGVLFHYADAGGFVDVLSGGLFAALASASRQGGDEQAAAMFERLGKVMPTPEQARAAIGAGGGSIVTTEQGLVGRSMLELTPATAAK